MVRLEASRTAANASGRMSSSASCPASNCSRSVSPSTSARLCAMRSLNSSVLARKASSLNASNCASSELISFAIPLYCSMVFRLGSPPNNFTKLFSIGLPLRTGIILLPAAGYRSTPVLAKYKKTRAFSCLFSTVSRGFFTFGALFAHGDLRQSCALVGLAGVVGVVVLFALQQVDKRNGTS